MRNFKKIIKLSFALVLSLMLVTGCGGDKTPASDVATMYLDVLTQKDKSLDKIKEYYGKDEDLESISIDNIKQQSLSLFNVSGITSEQKEKIIDALLNTMTKAEYTVEDAEEEGKVTIKIKGLDLQTILNDTQAQIQKDITAGKYKTQKQAIDAMLKVMVEKINSSKPGAKEKTLDVEFEKKDKKWIPKNPTTFGSQVAQSLMGM